MLTLTRHQREALKRVWLRDTSLTYRQLRRKVQPGPGCIMVPFCNFWLGVEPDGYTHS